MDGAVVGAARTRCEILERLEALDAPVAAVWLQDWVGQRKTSFGTQLWWNWELDRDHYPDWDSLGESLKRKNIRLMTYINPFVCDDVGLKKTITATSSRRPGGRLPGRKP